jgi:hypothetical protein
LEAGSSEMPRIDVLLAYLSRWYPTKLHSSLFDFNRCCSSAGALNEGAEEGELNGSLMQFSNSSNKTNVALGDV